MTSVAQGGRSGAVEVLMELDWDLLAKSPREEPEESPAIEFGLDDAATRAQGVLLKIMTRRSSKADRRDAGKFRHQRICKLIDRGWIQNANEIPEAALPVDPDLINLGGSYHRPVFFSDQSFTCLDCGAHCVWKAEDQRWYFETFHAPYYQTAKRCRACRRNERLRKNQDRVQAGHACPSPSPSPSEDAESGPRE